MTLMFIKYQFQKKESYGTNKSRKYFVGYGDNNDIK